MAHTNPADKTRRLDACLADIRSFVVDAVTNGLSFHDFEHGTLDRLLSAGRAATEDFLDQQGTGDLGPEVTLPDGQQVRRLPQTHTRPLSGVFGSFTLPRTCYGTREGQKIAFVPLDNRLQLPAGKFSYLLQEFNNLLATQDPFEQVADTLKRILRLEQHVDSLERQSQHTAEYVESFRAAQEAPPWPEEGTILVRTADAKGVPMRCAADAPSIRSHEHKRGPKTGRKKQAIVGAVYSVDPLRREPEDIVEMLFSEPAAHKPRPKRPELCFKRVMARLNEYTDNNGASHDGLAEVFEWLDRELDDRNPVGDMVLVNLFDGDERFAKQKKAGWEPGGVDILDLLHVTPRLWKVARLLAPRDKDAAEQQVRGWVLQVLRGKVEEVVADMRQRGAAAKLKGNKKKEMDKACNYLEERKGQMRYDEYLKAGYPIASGVIEGACRHYVKDRMERTGMSWKQPGAQAMLELRSVALNGTWDEFQAFYRQRECEALYPHRCLLDTVAWTLAQAA